MDCPSCGLRASGNARFCTGCGSTLGRSATVSASTPDAQANLPIETFTRIGLILGAIYLYFVAIVTTFGALVGIASSPYLLEKYASWIALLGAVGAAVVATTLWKERSQPGLLIYCFGILVTCWLFEQSHGAFLLDVGPGGGSVPVPGWSGALVSFIIASVLGAGRLVQMYRTTNIPLGVASFTGDLWRTLSTLTLATLIVIAIVSSLLAHNAGLFAAPPSE